MIVITTKNTNQLNRTTLVVCGLCTFIKDESKKQDINNSLILGSSFINIQTLTNINKQTECYFTNIVN